jgi:hypothetical protein
MPGCARTWAFQESYAAVKNWMFPDCAVCCKSDLLLADDRTAAVALANAVHKAKELVASIQSGAVFDFAALVHLHALHLWMRQACLRWLETCTLI